MYIYNTWISCARRNHGRVLSVPYDERGPWPKIEKRDGNRERDERAIH